MKKIYVDSSKIDEVIVRFEIDNQAKEEIVAAKNIKGSQVILQSIDRILKKEKTDIFTIDTIEISQGPGSYTGLRVGATVGNTIAFCLGIPINKKTIGEFVYPSYE